MVGDPVSALLAAGLVPVVAWCTYALVRPGRDPDHHRVPADVVAWHGVMGVVMLLALLRTTSAGWSWLAAGLFVVALLWCVLRTSSPRGARHYPRLFLMSGAMVAMLVPAGTANAATADDGMAMTHSQGSTMLLSGAGALVVAAAMAVVALAAVRVAGRPAPVRARMSACCEVVMAGSMAVMAATLV